MTSSLRRALPWLRTCTASLASILAPGLITPANAQTVSTASTQLLTVNWTSTTSNQLDCYGQSQCKPINIASCDSAYASDTAWPVAVSAVMATLAPSTTILVDTVAYFWVENSDGTCTFASANEEDKIQITLNQLINPNGILGSTQNPLKFPDHFPKDNGNTTRTYTTVDLLADIGEIINNTNICTTKIDSTAFHLCMALDVPANQQMDVTDSRGWLTFTVDTTAPPKPNTLTAVGSDEKINVTASVTSTSTTAADSFSVRYRQHPDDESESENSTTDCKTWATSTFATTSADASSNTADITLSNLENGITYDICAIAIDAAGNEGVASDIISVETQDECDFIECYPSDLDIGYCGAGSMPSILTMLAAWGLWRGSTRRNRSKQRKNRTIAPLVLILAGLLVGSTAYAKDPPDEIIPIAKQPDPVYSNLPKWGIDVRFGPFRPDISSDPAAKELYRNIFEQGNHKSLFNNKPLMKTIEGTWYFWRTYGLLGVYGRTGHWAVTGTSLRCSTAECTADSVTSTPATTENRMIIVPLQVGLVYKLDFFKRQWNIPLVPYVKGGIEYDFWWVTAGGSTTHTKPGNHAAKGGVWGYHGSAGLALNLDFIEPATARSARAGSNILDTYLYFDVQKSVVNDFGVGHRINLSGMQYSIGIAFDFM